MSDIKPIPDEDTYEEYDEETGMWGVFGVESGFCYSAPPTNLEPILYVKEFSCEMGYRDCNARGYCNGDC